MRVCCGHRSGGAVCVRGGELRLIINDVLYATGWAGGVHAYSLGQFNTLRLKGYFVTGEGMGPVQKLDDDTLAVFG